MLTTITELPEYIKRAESLLTNFERKAVIDYLAEHPLAGDVMEGTGGIRKLRWGRERKGKVVVCESFTTNMTSVYLCTCLRCLEKVSEPIYRKLIEMRFLGWSAFLFIRHWR